MTLSIGSTVWVFDENYRVYDYDKSSGGSGKIIYREHFRPRKITGETRISWVLEDGTKVNKKTLKTHPDAFDAVLTSEEQIDQACWVHEHRYPIERLIHRCNYAQLKAIAEIVGYQG